MRKGKINNMTSEELDEYCKKLPDNRPPKWSSAMVAIGFAIVLIIHFATTVAHGTPEWSVLTFAIVIAAIAVFLVYKIITFTH